MVLINTERCENALEARRREREYIEQLNATLNQIKRPVRTTEEANEYRKDYYEENKEDIKQKNKQYRIDNADIVKERAKIYRENHKEERSLKNKEWQEKNQEQIQTKRKIKTVCDCGAVYCKVSLRRHERTKKHQDYINSLQD